MSKEVHLTDDYRDSHKAPEKGENYDSSFYKKNYKNLALKWEEKILKQTLKKHKVKDYIDFACGTGRITRIIEPYVENAKGIDVSESMLNVAKSKSKKTVFKEVDITREDVSDIDAVDLVSAFRFFTNAQESLRKEVIDVLVTKIKPDGLFIFNLHMNSSSPFAIMARVYETFAGKREGFNHLSLENFKKRHLNRLGLEVLEVHGYGVIPIIREEKIYPSLFLSLLSKIENTLTFIPGMKHFSKYQIVICKKINDKK